MADSNPFARAFAQAFLGLIAPFTRRRLMTLGLFDGAKTYVIAAAMVLAGAAQILGIDMPRFDGHSAGQLVLEGLAVLFLRRGLKTGA